MAAEDEARTAALRAAFDRIAPDYDRAGPGCFAHFGRVLVDAAGLEPGQRVLDVATGRGAVLLPAAERVGPAGDVLGIDLSPAMVEAAGAEAAARGLPVRLAVMDAARPALDEAAFDHVLCGFGLMFLPALDDALAGLVRALRPGGRLTASTWRTTQADDLQHVLPEAGAEIRALADPDALASALAGAGLADVAVVESRATFRYADLEDYWQCARGTGLRRIVDGLAPAAADAVRAALATRVAGAVAADGSLALAASALIATARRP